MKVLAFDVSTKTGYAVFDNDGQKNSLIKYGLVTLPKKIGQNGNYPFGFLYYVQELVEKLIELVNEVDPDVLVIEETTGAGRASRYSLKALEFLHCTI
jgi:Holliday junction resolvasome RuvABC endonuclease subunit